MYHHYGTGYYPNPYYGTYPGYGYQPYGMGHLYHIDHLHLHYHPAHNHMEPLFAVPFGGAR